MATRLTASAPVFAALGDPQRILLVSRLCQNGPMSVARLTEGTGITRQAVTKHLRVLEGAGLARSEKSGRETIWALDQRPLDKAREHLDSISRQWDAAIERLRAFVE
ncbi:MAG: transcriptional regulator [Sorangiineae bacterium NIC37A_2]|nr:MAG: transcriptional regulator [Sorangiineae bacterium NIC37A_2]